MIRTLAELYDYLGIPRTANSGGPFSPIEDWEVMDVRQVVAGAFQAAPGAGLFNHQALCYILSPATDNRRVIVLPIRLRIVAAISQTAMRFFDDNAGAPWAAAVAVGSNRLLDRLMTGANPATGSANAAVLGMNNAGSFGYLISDMMPAFNIGSDIDLRGIVLGHDARSPRMGVGVVSGTANEALDCVYWWVEADLRRISR